MLRVHSNLDLGAVNLGVYLDLVAKSLPTEILLIKNSRFRRFGHIVRLQIPRFSSQVLTEFSGFQRFGVNFVIENQIQLASIRILIRLWRQIY